MQKQNHAFGNITHRDSDNKNHNHATNIHNTATNIHNHDTDITLKSVWEFHFTLRPQKHFLFHQDIASWHGEGRQPLVERPTSAFSCTSSHPAAEM